MNLFTPAKTSFLIALTVYVFILITGYLLYTSSTPKKELVTLIEVPVTLSMFQPTAPASEIIKSEQPAPVKVAKAIEPPIQTPIEKSPPPTEKPITPPIKKPVEPVIKTKPKAEPKVKPQMTPTKISPPPPKPSIEPIAETQPKILPPPIQTTQPTTEPVTKPLKAPSVPIPSNQTAEAEANYLSELKTIIAQHAYNSYPRQAKRRNWQGDVFIQFTLLPNGHITQLSIVESSGRKLLDNAALQIFQVKMNQQFKPFPKDITRTKWQIKVPVSYNLH